MRARPWRLPSICMLLFALLAGQALALLHGVAHMGSGPPGHPAYQVNGADAARAEAAHAHWAAGLFGQHAAGSGDCLVVGHGLSPGPLTVAEVVLPPPGALAAPAWAAARAPGTANASYFSARAPPTLV